LHAFNDAADIEPSRVEASTLSAIGMPEEIVQRHAAAHFLHIFAGDAYSAGYYSYLWAEVLDADGFAAFKEKDDAFDAETARRLYDNVYSVGGTRDFAETYRAFRGRDPKVEALLEGRGLAG
jgi:peptidyl-dipeptidase Dcp